MDGFVFRGAEGLGKSLANKQTCGSQIAYRRERACSGRCWRACWEFNFFCFQTLVLCAKVDNSVSAVLSRPEISQHEAQAPPAMNLHLCVTQHCTFPARAPHEGQQRLAVEVNRHQDISDLFAFLVLGWHYSSSDCNNVTMSNLQCLPFKSICV